MATAQKEIPIDDAELDALMAELEAETADAVETPKAEAAPAISDEEIEALEEQSEGDVPEPPPAATPLDEEPERVVVGDEGETQFIVPKNIKPAPELVEQNVDADMAALEAELASSTATNPPGSFATAATSELKELFAKGPLGEAKRIEGLAALEAAQATVDHEVKSATPPKKKELNYYIDMAQFRDDIKVSATNLDDCMMQQAGLRAYHGEQAALADAQHSRLKLRFEVVEASLYDRHRKALAAVGEKVTEKMVENAVKLDPEYVAAKNRVIEAETIAAVRRACTEALKDRKDMLVQLGADRREEGKGQLRILETESNHKALRERAAAAVANRNAA